MTTIVYRDGILAADGRTTDGDMIVPSPTTKVFKNRHGWLYGAAGDVADIKTFHTWAKTHGGVGSKKKPSQPPSGSYAGVLISPASEVWAVEDGNFWIMDECPFYCVGSGSAVAYGALGMGATAQEAVAQAIRFDTGSGPPISYVSLPKL